MIYTNKYRTWHHRLRFVLVAILVPPCMLWSFLWPIVVELWRGLRDGTREGRRRAASDGRALRTTWLLVTTGRNLIAERDEEIRERYFGSLPRRRKAPQADAERGQPGDAGREQQ